ncbi:MAG TPA: hypothetical protein PLY93_03610 [Turneriella sp.]|nr:hypothetical protein [Turneriella sp.]
MQKATLTHHFSFPFETLVEIREGRYNHLDIWDMFSAALLIHEEQETSIRKRQYKLIIRTALPLIAQKLLAKGERLSCEENTVLDKNKREYRSQTSLHIANSAIQFHENSIYLPNGENQSKCIIEIEANIKVPAIGKLIEKLIVHEFREQSTVDMQKIQKFYNDNY